MKNRNKLLCLLLALVLVFSLAPKMAVTAEAAGYPQEMTNKGFRASVTIMCDDGHADGSHSASDLTITSFSLSGEYITISGSFSYVCNGNTITKSFSGMSMYFGGCTYAYNRESGYILLNNDSETIGSNYALIWLQRNAGHQVTNGYTEVGDRHTANCIVCGAVDEACKGGTATCLREAVCAYCGGTYGTKNPNHHDSNVTYARNESDSIFQHVVRYSCCDVRVDPYRQENHTESIAPTCEHGPYCAVCDSYYNEGLKKGHYWATGYSADGSGHWKRCLNSGCEEKEAQGKHTWSTTYYSEGSKHYRKCTVCDYKDEHSPAWSVATCTTPKTCGICPLTDGTVDATNHNWGDWDWVDGTTTHARVCSRSSSHTESENCDHSAATCLAASECSVCGHQYASQMAHDYGYTASNGVITETCPNGCGHTATATLVAERGYTFNGGEIKPIQITYSADWKGPKDLSVSYEGQDTVNVNRVIATVTCEDATARISYEIMAATLSVSAENYSAPYDGKSHSIRVEAAAPGSTPVITYSLTGETGSYSATAPLFTDVTATTTVYYKVEAPNYNSTSGSKTVTITKAPLTVTASNDTVAYNDPTPEYAATYAGFVNGEDKSILGGTLALACDYQPGSNVGTYAITPSGLTSENYEITFAAGTLTVEKAQGQATVSIEDWTFGETASVPTSATTTNQNVTPVYTYAVKGEETYTSAVPTAAGSYTVKVTYAATENYTEATATADFTVEKAALVPAWLQIDPAEFVYNATSQVPAVTVNGGAIYGDLVKDTDYDVIFTGSNGSAVAEPTDADTYTVKVIGKGNFEGALTATFRIAPLAITVTPDALQTKVYSAEEPALTYTLDKALPAGETLTAPLKRQQGENVGSYAISLAAASANPNYTLTLAEGSHSFVITALELTASNTAITAPNLLHNGSEQDLTPTMVVTLLNGETKTLGSSDVTVTGNKGTGIGRYDITVTGKGNFTGTLNVTRKIVPDAATLAAVNNDTITPDNVSLTQKEALEKLKTALDSVNEDTQASNAELAAWEDAAEKLPALLRKLDALDESLNTEEYQAAIKITPTTVGTSDKEILEEAKKDIQAYLFANDDNITDAEEAALKQQIQIIDECLAEIEKAQPVIDEVKKWLKDNAGKFDADELKLREEWQAMDAKIQALPENVRRIAKGALDKDMTDAKTKLYTYTIIAPNGARWVRGCKLGMTFKTNGHIDLCTKVLVDGVELNPLHYNLSTGSTYVTLTQSFMSTLRRGNHTIVVVFADGQTDSYTFRVVPRAIIPQTGDQIMVAVTVMALSGAAIVVLLLLKKRKK